VDKQQGRVSAADEGLNAAQDKIAKRQEDQKKAAEAAALALQTLVEKFQTGAIKAEDFAKLLNTNLRPALQKLGEKAGKNLGLRFTNDFVAQMNLLVDQAKVLGAFAGRASPSGVVNPNDTIATNQRAKADASARLSGARGDLATAQKNLSDAIAASKETASNTSTMVTLLDAINKAVRAGSNRVPTTHTKGATSDNTKQTSGGKVPATGKGGTG
jgi:hypothetical protein